MEKDYLRIGAAYIRVSDERQDEYSPDSQLKKIREHAAKEKVCIPDEYVFYDDGISGRNVKKRDDFNRMIGMAKEKDHPFDVIYVWKFSRFARNQEQAILFKNLLRKNDVAVVSVSEPVPEGPFGTLIERIIEWMDEFYSINLGVEVSRGMEEKFSRGEPTCAAPYGYLMKDSQWFPDEESGKADIVREAFRRFADGEGLRTIASTLNDRGVRTKFGGKPDNRWIEYMLTNPSYIGMLRRSSAGDRAVSRRDYTNESILTIKGKHSPIIDEATWDAVQKRLSEQKAKYAKHARKEQHADYMLKGLVRCSACGATLAAVSISHRDKYRRMQCCNYQRGSCTTSHGINIPTIEAAFIEGLETAIGTQTFTMAPKTTTQAKSKDAPDYDRMIALEERRLARAKEAYLNEIDSIEQYKQNKDEITARIEELKAQKTATIPTQANAIDTAAFANKVAKVVEFIKREDVTPTAKNAALHDIIEKIIYHKATQTLSIYFHA